MSEAQNTTKVPAQFVRTGDFVIKDGHPVEVLSKYSGGVEVILTMADGSEDGYGSRQRVEVVA